MGARYDDIDGRVRVPGDAGRERGPARRAEGNRASTDGRPTSGDDRLPAGP